MTGQQPHNKLIGDDLTTDQLPCVDMSGFVALVESRVAHDSALLAALAKPPASIHDLIARMYLKFGNSKDVSAKLRDFGIRKTDRAGYSPADVLDIAMKSDRVPAPIKLFVLDVYSENFQKSHRAWS